VVATFGIIFVRHLDEIRKAGPADLEAVVEDVAVFARVSPEHKLKHFRRIATRYEKRAANYLAMITLAAILLWL
jgi:transposase